MPCDYDHADFTETCACWCACDTPINHRSLDDICFGCANGEHDLGADFFYDDDDSAVQSQG